MKKMTRFIAVKVCPSLALALFVSLSSLAHGASKEAKEPKPMTTRYFLDVHDRADGTFPAKLSKEEFAGFFQKYEAACREEGVTLVRVDVGLEDGRAYCVTIADSVDAVKRAHQRVGLPYQTITEVASLTPGDLSFAPLGPRHGEARKAMPRMKSFVDVHDRRDGTFPAKLSKDDLVGFFQKYEAACRAEGVVLVRVQANLEDGRAYCYTTAESAEAVRRAHARVGLPYQGITEVVSATPSDLGFAAL